MDRDRQRAKELFRQMTWKEKIVYIYEEYRFHILAAVVVAALLISMGTTILNKKTEVLWGMVINQSIAESDTFLADLEAELELDKKQCVSLINEIYLVPEDLANPSSLSYATATQIICAAAVSELDFAITDVDGLIYLNNNGLCTDVEKILPEDLMEIYGQYLFTPEELDFPIAIDLKAMGISEALGLKGVESYLALPNMSGNEAYLFTFLRYIASLPQS